tara:strand:+ start:2163 stop:2306 length:144 start_codon:yes stop_codon:yes gene_type:complete
MEIPKKIDFISDGVLSVIERIVRAIKKDVKFKKTSFLEKLLKNTATN